MKKNRANSKAQNSAPRSTTGASQQQLKPAWLKRGQKLVEQMQRISTDFTAWCAEAGIGGQLAATAGAGAGSNTAAAAPARRGRPRKVNAAGA